ncbi:MAG: D-glycerate dehydrogenase [Myxococcota bacterium]
MPPDSQARLAVFMASRLIDAVEASFESKFDVTRTAGGDPIEELLASERAFDAMVLSLDVKMGADQIEKLPSTVRALATYSVGTDHIDLVVARRRGLAVFNTPGVLADSVAENALFLMLGAARRATESIDLIRGRAWSGWSPEQLVGVQLAGRTLGILGMGDIGLRVASRARALGMEILYCNRQRRPEADSLAADYRADAQALIRDSDVLLLACPSTEQTRGILNAALLKEAKPELIVVNIARGDLVEDKALIAALRDRRVWAAGLDVFEGEPDLDPDYFELPNVFMLPHIGSSTLEARVGMGEILVDALSGWWKGLAVANRVC